MTEKGWSVSVKSQEKDRDSRIIIAYVIDFLASQEGLTGGTERQLIEMVNHLDQSRFRPIVCCLQELAATPYWNVINCEKHLLHVYSLVSLAGARAFLSFVRFLRENSVDIVQTYFHDSTLFGILAARVAGTRAAISCRRDLGFWYNGQLLRSMSFVNRFTDRILVNCSAVKSEVVAREGVAPEKIDVIHNGIDLAAFDREPTVDLQEEFPDIGNNDRVIGMVANFNREVKRADLFIRAAAEVLKQYGDLKFLLIGGGKLEHELKNQINRFGLQGMVILGGKKEPSAPYIKAFDIGVLASDSEGFSNVLLEYMAAGLPVVATEVGGNREIIRNQGLGHLVPKGDWAALAQSICNLLDDNTHRRELGENARENVVEHYSWEKSIRDVESYYEELLER